LFLKKQSFEGSIYTEKTLRRTYGILLTVVTLGSGDLRPKG
jgi:hypothetical protein